MDNPSKLPDSGKASWPRKPADVRPLFSSLRASCSLARFLSEHHESASVEARSGSVEL